MAKLWAILMVIAMVCVSMASCKDCSTRFSAPCDGEGVQICSPKCQADYGSRLINTYCVTYGGVNPQCGCAYTC